jgi:endonuclease/exonuclease/phosphatase (EEP) superfamily protein YafD
MNLKGSPATARGPVIRVISANLLMVNRDTPPILREIEDANADLVFLQEYTEHWDKEFTQWFGQAYPYRLIYPQEDSFGAAIYSRHPFAGQPKLDSSMGKWGIVQLSADVAVGNTIIQCRNVHLVPPRNWDYTVEHLDEMREFEQRLRGNSSRNVIIAGDFNFTGSTLQANAIARSGFHDAFDEAGSGRGATWPVNGVFRYLPGIRLDHIFLSQNLHCRRIETGNGYGSDHRPLIAELELLPTR